MKKNLLFISISLLVNACSGNLGNSLIQNSIRTEPRLFAQEVDEGIGGNPEVYIAHNCLKNKSAQTCLEKLFNDERKVYIQSYETIKLAGRGSSVEEATITFEDDDLFMLYLDTSNVEKPLSTNIKKRKLSTDNNSLLFIFPVTEIADEIIIKDKRGEVVLKYKILKKQ